MSVIQAIFLGFVQGIAEFLPISSSGHLILFPRLFGWSDQGMAFDMIVHLGTLLALIIFFRSRLSRLFRAAFSRATECVLDKRLFWMVALTTVPAVVVAFFFGDLIEEKLRAPIFVATNLIVFGIIMYIVDRRIKTQQDLSSIKSVKSFSIGVAQSIALAPGVSRSGITMTVGRLFGLSRTAAAEYSFLVSIPVVFLAGLSGFINYLEQADRTVSVWSLLIGFLSAAFFGHLAIKYFLKFLNKYGLGIFAVYRIILGIIILFIFY